MPPWLIRTLDPSSARSSNVYLIVADPRRMKYLGWPEDSHFLGMSPGGTSPIVPSLHPPYLLSISSCHSRRPCAASPLPRGCPLLAFDVLLFQPQLHLDLLGMVLSLRRHLAIFGHILITPLGECIIMGRGLGSC